MRSFLTQEVLLRKWSAFHWVFVRRSVERCLGIERALAGRLLRDLFDEATMPGTGLAAMDFGYAFDSLIWVSI